MEQSYGKATTISQSQGASFDKVRLLARQYVDALSSRLKELHVLAKQANTFTSYTAQNYPAFRKLCSVFTKRSQEFQGLSSLIENALSQFPQMSDFQQNEKRELEKNFRYLQVPMLTQIILTSSQLLGVWRDRLEKKVPLPIDVQENFMEMVKIVQDAKFHLEQPEYATLVNSDILETAETALQFLDVLINQAPTLKDFDTKHIKNKK